MCRMGRYGINEEDGIVEVFKVCPREGDSVLIVNCGDHFEVRQRSGDAILTDEDIRRLTQGQVTWH